MWPAEERVLNLQTYRSMLYQIGDRGPRLWAVLSHAGQGHIWRAYKAMLELAHDTFPDKFKELIATAGVTEPNRVSGRNDMMALGGQIAATSAAAMAFDSVANHYTEDTWWPAPAAALVGAIGGVIAQPVAMIGSDDRETFIITAFLAMVLVCKDHSDHIDSTWPEKWWNFWEKGCKKMYHAETSGLLFIQMRTLKYEWEAIVKKVVLGQPDGALTFNWPKPLASQNILLHSSFENMDWAQMDAEKITMDISKKTRGSKWKPDMFSSLNPYTWQ